MEKFNSKFMSKERYSQIIDEVYKNYLIEDAKVSPNMSKEKMTIMGQNGSL